MLRFSFFKNIFSFVCINGGSSSPLPSLPTPSLPFLCQLQPCSVNGINQLTECWHHASGCKAVRICALLCVCVYRTQRERPAVQEITGYYIRKSASSLLIWADGQGKGNGLLGQEKILLTHTYIHMLFSLLSLNTYICVVAICERELFCSSGSDHVPSGSSNSWEVKQFVFGLFFLPPFRSMFL